MLTGCPFSTQPKKVSIPKVSEQARTSCGELQEFKTGTKSEILFVVTDTADKFHSCKNKHDTVVQEYRNLEKSVEKFNKGL